MEIDLSILYDAHGNICTAKIKNEFKWLKLNNQHLYDEIQHWKLSQKHIEFKSDSQLLYHIEHSLHDYPVCKCGNSILKFYTFKRGYSDVCSMRCSKIGITPKNPHSQESRYNLLSLLLKKIKHSVEFKTFADKYHEIDSLNCDSKNNRFINSFNKQFDLVCTILYYTKDIIEPGYTTIEELRISERAYIIQNKLTGIPLCGCGNKLKFYNFKIGYSKFCSNKCSNLAAINRLTNVQNKIITRLTESEYELIGQYTGRRNVTQVKHKKCGTVFNRYFHNGSCFTVKRSCPKCFKYKHSSKPEYDIIDLLKSNGIEYIHQYKLEYGINRHYELDIFIPSMNIAIEYNGIYWHSEKKGTGKNYHLNKTNICKEKGIQLLHIFENEWINNKKIVKSIILSKLGIYTERLQARKCIIKEIDQRLKDKFLEENHIQGKDKSKFKLGLFYDDELVSVMTFGSRSITGSKISQYELIRYCTKLNTQIIGGASKLLKHAIKLYQFSSLISYADKRYSNGRFYQQLGFTLSHESTPNYWYFEKSRNVLLHRAQFMKHNLKNKLPNFDGELTEWQNMLNNGWNRIWDCGNFVYTWQV